MEIELRYSKSICMNKRSFGYILLCLYKILKEDYDISFLPFIRNIIEIIHILERTSIKIKNIDDVSYFYRGIINILY